MAKDFEKLIKTLEKLSYSKMYMNDFYWTWDKTEDELKAAETEIQKITDKNVEEVDKIVASKETEIMSI